MGATVLLPDPDPEITTLLGTRAHDIDVSAIRSKLVDVSSGDVGYTAGYARVWLRVGLGIVVLLAGVSKYVQTAMWTKYYAPWFGRLWPTTLVSLETLTYAQGFFEILFGIALMLGFHTSLVAGIWALTMLGIVINLFTVFVTSGKYVGILIRDVGLFSLAVGVMLLSANRFTSNQSRSRG